MVSGQFHCDDSYHAVSGVIGPSKKFVDKYNVAMAGVLVQPNHSGRVLIRL